MRLETLAFVTLAASAAPAHATMVAIVALPVPPDGVDSAALYDEPFRLAVPAQHELAGRSEARIEDLNGETVLLLEDGHCLRDQALEVCNRAHAQESQDYRATSLETLRQMVAAGHGVTLLPELAVSGQLAQLHGMQVKTFVNPAPARTIGAVWRKSSTRGIAIDAIIASIRGAMQSRTGSRET